MKYLIISDAASMHIYNFVRFFLLDKSENNEIYILRHSVCPIPEQYARFYAENNITVFSPGKEDDGNGKLATVKRFLRKVLFLKKLGKADVCHIQYAHRSSCLLYRMFKRNFTKLIITFWGTDILKPPAKEVEQQRKTLPYADKITVTVENSKNVFIDRFGHGYDDKLVIAHFASGALPKIKEFSETTTKAECRKAFGIPNGKRCLVCGYNADHDQRQDICLEEIGKLPQEIKDTLYCIVPMQYGRTDTAYIDRVKLTAQKCGCEYEILEEYVPFERNATMCLATDIYLNLRVSDAFSNAMKEQIVSGSLMIQGEWMKYIELDKMNAPVVKISKLSELHTVLEKVMREYKFSDEIKIFIPMFELFNPSSLKKEWNKIFESLGIR